MTTRSKTLVIVPCGKSKIWDKDQSKKKVPAADAYTGNLFKLHKDYADFVGDDWIILSAKYGFIAPSRKIEDYNVTFKSKKSGPISIEKLRQQIEQQNLTAYSTIIGLGGKEYIETIKESFAEAAVNFQFPFQGLPIGKMQKAIKKAIKLNWEDWDEPEIETGFNLDSPSDEELLQTAIHHHDEVKKIAIEAARSMLTHSRKSGEALAELKKRVGHGGWADWIQENFTASQQTASKYIRIAENWELLEPELEQIDSIRAAIRFINQHLVPPEEKEPKNDPVRTHLELAPAGFDHNPLLDFRRYWNSLTPEVKRRIIKTLSLKPGVMDEIQQEQPDSIRTKIITKRLHDIDDDPEPKQRLIYYYSGGSGSDKAEQILKDEANLMLSFWNSFDQKNNTVKVERRFKRMLNFRTGQLFDQQPIDDDVPFDQSAFKQHFLDSGEFGRAKARKAGKSINQDGYLEKYADFIKSNKAAIDYYANLDVIGDPVKTRENQHTLESFGLEPIPIVHFGTDLDEVERYLNEGYDYIGIGGLVKVMARAEYWLDKVFDLICNQPDRLPEIKVHGFGVGMFRHLKRYPWYSVDNTKWEIQASYGAISIPRRRKDGNKTEWVYNINPHLVHISDEGENKPNHFNKLSKRDKEIVEEWLASLNFTIEELARPDEEAGREPTDCRDNRIKANLAFFSRAAKTLTYPSPFLSTVD